MVMTGGWFMSVLATWIPINHPEIRPFQPAHQGHQGHPARPQVRHRGEEARMEFNQEWDCLVGFHGVHGDLMVI